jgi:hypothetical protein
MRKFDLSAKLFYVRCRIRLLRARKYNPKALTYSGSRLAEGVSIVANMVSTSNAIVVVTGQDVAAESGLTIDIRSKDHDLWKKYDRNTYGSFDHFISHPEYFWDMHSDILKFFEKFQPNSTHFTINKWFQEGRIKHIISETIDDLHVKAGNFGVTEVNGTLSGGTCRLCRMWHTRHAIDQLMKTAAEIPMSINEPLSPQLQNHSDNEEKRVTKFSQEIDLDDPTTFKKILVPLCVRCVSPLKLDVCRRICKLMPSPLRNRHLLYFAFAIFWILSLGATNK